MSAEQNGGRASANAADVAYAMGPYVSRLKELEDKVGDQGDKLRATAKQAGLAVKTHGDLKELTETLEGVVERLEKLESDRKQARPLNLLEMDAAELAATIRNIGFWLDDVGVRYGLLLPPASVRENLVKGADRPGGNIKPCWYQHWDALYELAWLYQAWHNAYYGKTASLRAVSEWHDKHLNQALLRINAYGTMRNCDSSHQDPYNGNRGIATGRVDREGMEEFLAVLSGGGAAVPGPN